MTDQETDQKDNIEELILKESIISAAGLNPDQVQIGIKGDPSIRESVLMRKRYTSTVIPFSKNYSQS